MDLPPDLIGKKYGNRIAPVGSDIPVLKKRCEEAIKITIDDKTAKRIILLMRQDLRDGFHHHYDDPVQLRELHSRASDQA
ncbi:hypothetical protein QN372_07995 [Undibacterium sp. RTI2.1]|uniref:hypothetical protein n=1 Tax=unclassified Undibacterium TaxID=2630295 RepID=UPI002B23BD88|nr:MULTISPECIES: hypothetical protein [unclassified Undibacterium]MEB0030682.1 hypothetical protein [Undibacterium sp. RTI2.1]MEB0117199.1 hypothetical protein [Undibacterium sp. RTI2.2]